MTIKHQKKGNAMKFIFIALFIVGLWNCSPDDFVTPQKECADTSWVIGLDSIRPVVHHYPCKVIFDPNIGDFLPTIPTW